MAERVVKTSRNKKAFESSMKPLNKLVKANKKSAKTHSEYRRPATTVSSGPSLAQNSTKLSLCRNNVDQRSADQSKFSPRIAEENQKIRMRLKEYSELLEPAVKLRRVASTSSQESVVEKLRDQAALINALLSKEDLIKTINPFSEEVAVASVSAPYYARLKCKSYPSRLIINISVERGIGCSHLFLSLTHEKPSIQQNHKAVPLIKRNQIVVFAEDSKRPTFRQDWIYLALESTRECCVYFTCSFGKGGAIYEHRAKCGTWQ